MHFSFQNENVPQFWNENTPINNNLLKKNNILRVSYIWRRVWEKWKKWKSILKNQIGQKENKYLFDISRDDVNWDIKIGRVENYLQKEVFVLAIIILPLKQRFTCDL